MRGVSSSSEMTHDLPPTSLPPASSLATSASSHTKDPECGSDAIQCEPTLILSLLFQEDTSRLSKAHGPIRRRHGSRTGTQELLRFVDVVDTPTPTADVLRVQRSDDVSSGPDAEDQGILCDRQAAYRGRGLPCWNQGSLDGDDGTTGRGRGRGRRCRGQGWGLGRDGNGNVPLTFALTGSSYSVLRCTTKCRTDCLCSCWSSPCTMNGNIEFLSSNTDLGTSFRTKMILVPGYAACQS